jgi:hypothetical protein
VKELSGILKIPSFLHVKKKPPNPKKLNPHGRCLTSQEFTLERERASKEIIDNLKAKDEAKKKKLDEKAKKKMEKKKESELKKKAKQGASVGPHTKKRLAFVTPLMKLP